MAQLDEERETPAEYTEPATNPSPRNSIINDLQTGWFNFTSLVEEQAKTVISDVRETWNMQSQLTAARVSLEEFLDTKTITPEEQIPRAILKGAKGIIFLTQYKGGFGVAGEVGSGILIFRTQSNQWSGPMSLGLGGGSFGFQMGFSKVDHIIVLQDESAVRAFQGNAQVNIGGDVCVAAGPVGRNASIGVGGGDGGVAPMLSYSMSQGFFAGVSLDARTFFPRSKCNEEYYNRRVDALDLMEESVEVPLNRDLTRIIQLLDHYTKTDEERRLVAEQIRTLAIGDEDGLVSPPPESYPVLDGQAKSDSFGDDVLETLPDIVGNGVPDERQI